MSYLDRISRSLPLMVVLLQGGLCIVLGLMHLHLTHNRSLTVLRNWRVIRRSVHLLECMYSEQKVWMQALGKVPSLYRVIPRV